MNHRRNHPRVRPGLLAVPTPRGLVVEGGARRHLLTGRAATDILPRLLPLLDGTRDAAGICAESGLTGRQLNQVLTTLARRDLLTPLDHRQGGGSQAEQYLTRLQPFADHAVTPGDVIDLREVLASQHVAVVAQHALAERISADLRACGVGKVSPFDCELPGGGRDFSPPTIVVVQDQHAGSVLEQVIALCARTETRPDVLRFSARHDSVDVGPRFTTDGYTACLTCFREGHAEAFPEVRPADSVELPAAASELSAGLVSAAVLDAVVGSASEATAARSIWRTDLVTLTTESFLVVPEALCSRCTAPPGNESDRYEWLVQLPPPQHKAMQGGVDPEASIADENRMDYATSPRRVLATASVPAEVGTARTESVVSLLLALTAGLKSPRADPPQTARWAPTGGGLGSVELFLLTEDDWTGLPGTVFKYDAQSHALISARSDSPSLATLLQGTGMEAAGLRFAVVFVAATWRLAPKYDIFSHRLAHLDAGCAATQFGLVCRDLELQVSTATLGGGDLDGYLELDPDKETVTVLACIHGKEPGNARTS